MTVRAAYTNIGAMPLTQQQLTDLVHELSSRPKHEKVRSLVYDLLVHELGVRSTDIEFEKPVWEIRGRLDALLGQTVFEFKSDLRREKQDAEEGLERYLTDRERDKPLHFLGIATDGADWMPYELKKGNLTPLTPYRARTESPRGLVAFLDAAIAVQGNVEPQPQKVRDELGKESLAYQRARRRLAEMWAEVATIEEVQLKRQLWSGLMEHRLWLVG